MHYYAPQHGREPCPRTQINRINDSGPISTEHVSHFVPTDRIRKKNISSTETVFSYAFSWAPPNVITGLLAGIKSINNYFNNN